MTENNETDDMTELEIKQIKHRDMMKKLEDLIVQKYGNVINTENIWVKMMGGDDIIEEAKMWDIMIEIKEEHKTKELKQEIYNYISNLCKSEEFKMIDGYQILVT